VPIIFVDRGAPPYDFIRHCCLALEIAASSRR
jgi:hypothetical protein